MQTHPPPDLPIATLELAQDCVMCGICVPHCPTFPLSGNEADGPRGRISLMLGLNEGTLAADAATMTHLDSCLACRACESVCPSQVQYGRLIDATRAGLASEAFATPEREQAARNRASQKPWKALRDHVLTRRRRLGRLVRLAYHLQNLKLSGLIARLGGTDLRTLWRSLPPKPATLARKPAYGTQAGRQPGTHRIGLFSGCTGEAMNADAVRATQTVLEALGYEIVFPAEQGCCGAMHRHGGDLQQADRLVQHNRQVFSPQDVEAIVVVGTACAAELREQAADLPVHEITAFLSDLPAEHWPPMQALDATVAIHLPCSQTRVLHQSTTSRALLERIPGLMLQELAGNDRCCGAAGLHVLLYPQQADALRRPKLDALCQEAPDYLVSANVGCAAHLAAGLTQTTDARPVRVLQPVELLAMALAPY